MNKAQNYLGLAKKAGLLETGEENTGSVVKSGKARLVLLASDASDNARRRAEGFVREKNVPLITVPMAKADISFATGRPGCSMAVFTDIGLAASFASALAVEDTQFEELATALGEKNVKLEKRRRETNPQDKTKKFSKRRKSV